MTNCYSVVDNVDYLLTVYVGTQATTRSGYTCMNWQRKTPHFHHFIPADFGPTISTWGELSNYCRDPARLGHPWCFTTDPNVVFDYCDVPSCDGTTAASDPVADLPDNRTPSIALLSGTIGGAIVFILLSILVYVKCVKPLREKRKKGQLTAPIVLRPVQPVDPSLLRPRHPAPNPLPRGPLSQGVPHVTRRDVRPPPSVPKKAKGEDSSDEEGQDALERQLNPAAAPALAFMAERFGDADGFVPDENPFQIKVTTNTNTNTSSNNSNSNNNNASNNNNNRPPSPQPPSPTPASGDTAATTRPEPAQEGGDTVLGSGPKLAPILSSNTGRGSKKSVAFAEGKPSQIKVSSSSAFGPSWGEDTSKSSENSVSGKAEALGTLPTLVASKALPPLAGPLSNPDSPRAKHSSLSSLAGHSRYNLDDSKGSSGLSPNSLFGPDSGQTRMSGLTNGDSLRSSNTGGLSQVSPLLASRKKADNAWTLPKPGPGNSSTTAEFGSNSSLPKLAPPSSPQKSSNLPTLGQSLASPRGVDSVPKLPTLVASSQPAPLDRATVLTKPGAGATARLVAQQSLDGGWTPGEGGLISSRQSGWAPGEGGPATRKGGWTTGEGGLTPRQGGQLSEGRGPGPGGPRENKSLLTPRLGGQGGWEWVWVGEGQCELRFPPWSPQTRTLSCPRGRGRKLGGSPYPL